MSKDKIMIVDNELEIIQLMRLYLSREGYDIVWTTNSLEATQLANSENPDLIILDIVMPGLSGLDLCGKLREKSNVPILFVSCKDSEIDKVLGLSIGGDDYLSKPFGPAELVARVKAHLRRSKLSEPTSKEDQNEGILSFEDLEINLAAHTVTLKGESVHLTATEFSLLTVLCKDPNRVFTAVQLSSAVWDFANEEDLRTIMVHISNIRKKLKVISPDVEYIHTVRGVGYKFIH